MAVASGISCTLWHPPTVSSYVRRRNSFLPLADPSGSSLQHLSVLSFQLSSHPTDRCLSGDVGRTTRRRNAVVCEVVVEISGAPSTEGSKTEEPAIGARIRVKGPLKVCHVSKIPEFDLGGQEGEIKDILKSWKGKTISANLPYKVQFQLEVEGRQVKFIAHLKEGEFEVVN